MVTVVDYDRVGASEPIGHIVLGCDAKGAELKHWSEMLSTPRRPVAQWHTLKAIKGEKKQLGGKEDKQGVCYHVIRVEREPCHATQHAG